MAITAVSPATLATLVAGDSVAFTIDDTYTSVVVKVQTATALVAAYSTALGGGQSGYSFEVVDNGDGTHTFTFTADSGWDVTPQLIYVVEDETGTEATTNLSYTITGEAAFPQGEYPYNPTTSSPTPDVEGPDSVTDNAVVLFDGVTGKLIKEVASLGTSGQVLTSNGAGAAPTMQTAAGTGDVVGPASATDDAIVVYDGTTGKLVKDSTGTIAQITANTAKVTNATHTGDVTGDTALTIAAKAVDVAMLADGTDGELITWSAAGVAETVAVGTATHVLTSNGVGVAPTFQAPAGGGGGGGLTTLASNELISIDATEVVIGGAVLDGSSGGTYSWSFLATYNDNGGTGNQDLVITLYDRGAVGTPVAGVLRSTLTLDTSADGLDALHEEVLTLTGAATPGTDSDEIDSDEPRMYEIRAKLDAGGAVDTALILNVKFSES